LKVRLPPPPPFAQVREYFFASREHRDTDTTQCCVLRAFPGSAGPTSRFASRIAIRYTGCMAQLVTRVDDELAAAIDDLVRQGAVANRSEAVRVGLQQLVDRHRRQRLGAQIAASYSKTPQADSEVGWADESSVRMIAEEPW
jgi:Arc/MetJ-type ribon-helix-helix transcriptional regulator